MKKEEAILSNTINDNKETISSTKEVVSSNSINDNKEAISIKKLEKENKKLKDIVEKLKSDLAEQNARTSIVGIVVSNLKMFVRVVVME